MRLLALLLILCAASSQARELPREDPTEVQL